MIFILSVHTFVVFATCFLAVADAHVIGPPGEAARYHLARTDRLPGSVINTVSINLGRIESIKGVPHQWLHLSATKANGQHLRIWLLSAGFPSRDLRQARTTTARYILQEGDAEPLEFRHRFTGRAVLPSVGGWSHLIPRAPVAGGDAAEIDAVGANVFPPIADYLGHRYLRAGTPRQDAPVPPPNARVIRLLPDVLIGVPHNTRQEDETRRYDDSDYQLVPLSRDDYREMIDAGLNGFAIQADQVAWLNRSDVFYFGVGAEQLPYPECLYRSQYLGPTLYLDEPAVVTRDHVLRPRLRKEPDFRKAISPGIALQALEKHFDHVLHDGAPRRLIKGLAAREDVDLGAMRFGQQNIFSWETMVSSAAFELSQDPGVPAAMVFEPPGRIGVRRTLPEMNMTYGCQIPVSDPNHLFDIIIGYLRGAARLTGKSWGISIYGQFDQGDAFGFLTHAYDLGATRFFFWDTHRLACVPYGEVLALARNLHGHALQHPDRDLPRLRRAAEVAILLPPGYNLGHVAMGKGSLWGIGELNLQRKNRQGVRYRVVMHNFFTEIERCLRLGVAFDLMWDLPGTKPEGYREVVRAREDGKVQVVTGTGSRLLDQARTPPRPGGKPPRLTVNLTGLEGPLPLHVRASAHVVEGSAPIYYTFGADPTGIHHNAMVAWELYGPEEEDYRFLRPDDLQPQVRSDGKGGSEVEMSFRLQRPGTYRLRVATVDLAGRTAVVCNEIAVPE